MGSLRRGILLAGLAALLRAEDGLVLKKPPLPECSQSNPVDCILEGYFRGQTFVPPAPVGDAAFARRTYLDLWGLLPTDLQLDAFLADTRPGKRAALVDALLANRRHYRDHWISFWNDLLRNDEGVNYLGDRKSITPWLAKALDENMPYDRMVARLLNPEPPGDPDGFLAGVNWRGAVSASQTPAMQAAQNSAQVFLGINLKCASCHDSLVGKWKLNQAYALAGMFAEAPLPVFRCDVATNETAVPAFLFPELERSTVSVPAAGRRRAAALFTSTSNGRFARTFVNRIWHRLFGQGIVPSLDDMERRSWHPQLLDWLAADFVESGYDTQALLRRIATSSAYQLPAAAKSEHFRGPLVRRITAEQFTDAVSSITGEWRVLQRAESIDGVYDRDWRFKASPLARALGRPIRDQVYTERNSEASSMQALEFANGATLSRLLQRGAKRMAGELPTVPASVFDSGPVDSTVKNSRIVPARSVNVDIDISRANRLWLLVQDNGSYDPTRVTAGWLNATLSGEAGNIPLAALIEGTSAERKDLHFPDGASGNGVVMPLSSEIVLDIAGRGLKRFQATAGVDRSAMETDIRPKVRFFVFTREPDREQLVHAAGDAPVKGRPWERSGTVIADRLYKHALARKPSAAESAFARRFLDESPSAARLEDFLWALFMSPEFQYIH